MSYIGNIPVPQATQTRDRFTATSGQTTFATSGYTPGFLDVYLNGVHLDASDYTATNGSDVVLDTGAATDDIVEVVAFTAFEVANVAGATGAGGDKVFYENDTTVTTSYTITSGKNAVTAGPVTINSGVTVTVPSGSSWTIVGV